MNNKSWRIFSIVRAILAPFKYATPLLSILLVSYFVSLQNIEENQEDIDHRTFLVANILITNQFSKEEKEVIEQAIYEWNSKTKGLVELTPLYEPFKEIDFTNSVLMMKAYKHDPGVIIMDAFNKCEKCTVGIYRNSSVPHIKLVSARIKDLNHLYTVSLHELGHYIGLGHLEDPKFIGSVMYPAHIGFRRELTPYDLKYFCDIYSCTEQKRREILTDESYQIYLP